VIPKPPSPNSFSMVYLPFCNSCPDNQAITCKFIDL
jgi:hypothetical protein